MKTSLLFLSLLSASAFASTSDENQLQQNLTNPELYKQHHIQLVKEEQHRFLFFPYTREVIINDVKLVGTDVVMSSQLETPYIQSVTRNENNEVIINKNTLKTGLLIQIKTLEHSNKQTLSVSNSELVSMEDFTTNLNSENSEKQTEQQPLTIQLPTTKENYFSDPIYRNHFEKTWKDSSGTKYKLIYNGEKNLVKS